MRQLVLSLLLLAVIAFLPTPIQKRLRRLFQRTPSAILGLALGLTLLFAILAVTVHAFSIRLVLLVLVYTCLPSFAAYVQGAGPVKQPALLDFVTILLLWLPLEFAAGQHLVPK